MQSAAEAPPVLQGVHLAAGAACCSTASIPVLDEAIPATCRHLAALQGVPLTPDAHTLVRLEAPEDLRGLHTKCKRCLR